MDTYIRTGGIGKDQVFTKAERSVGIQMRFH